MATTRIGILFVDRSYFNCRVATAAWTRIVEGQHDNWNLQSLCGEMVSRLQVPTDRQHVYQLMEGGIDELPDGVLGKWTEDATQPEQAPPPMLPTSIPSPPTSRPVTPILPQVPTPARPMTPSSSSSSMDDDGEGSQTEGEDARLWPHATVLLLLDVFRNKRHLLQLPTMKKDDVWKQIAAEMKTYGYNYSGHTCLKKWNNLKNRYKIICDRNKATGRERTKWAYMDKMADLLQGDPSVVPPVVISSVKGVTVNTPEGPNSATATKAPTWSPTSKTPVPSTSKVSLPVPSAKSTSLRGASEVDGEDGAKKQRRRKRDPPQWFKEPPEWMRASEEKQQKTMDRLVEAAEEKNKLFREFLGKL